MKAFIILFLMIASFANGQEKTNRQRTGFRLFSLGFHHRQKPITADTTFARITVTHKIKSSKPSQTFYGWVIRNGKKRRYYCESWEPLPIYLVVQKVQIQ